MYLLYLLTFLLCSSFTLGERLLQAKKGEYIVTEQEKNYSLLLIRKIDEESILFEEVSVPSHAIDLKNVDWAEWMKKGAPGHTSWIQYEIDPSTFALVECYSFSKKGWLYLEESEHFLAKLFTLPLTIINESERRRIGPPPQNGELDARPIWNPPFLWEGKKNKLSTQAWKGFWPKDDTLLSSCEIKLYFPSPDISSFPLWIEATNGHFTYPIKAVKIGSSMTSFLKNTLPRRAPVILRSQKKEDSLFLSFKSPAYYKHFSLFAFDLLEPAKHLGPISFSLNTSEEKGVHIINISNKELEKHLVHNHRYKWILIPTHTEARAAESEDFFVWTRSSMGYEQIQSSKKKKDF